jgi:hypothetical protein
LVRTSDPANEARVAEAAGNVNVPVVGNARVVPLAPPVVVSAPPRVNALPPIFETVIAAEPDAGPAVPSPVNWLIPAVPPVVAVIVPSAAQVVVTPSHFATPAVAVEAGAVVPTEPGPAFCHWAWAALAVKHAARVAAMIPFIVLTT